MNETEELIGIASALAPLLTAGLGFYQKVQQNNQNSGLVPASDLFADALSIGKDIEATADKELADLTPLSAPDA